MLVFTNRKIKAEHEDEFAFSSDYPVNEDLINLVEVSTHSVNWVVKPRNLHASDDEVVAGLKPLFSGLRPVVVYIHGFNNPPEKCLTRASQISVQYEVEVVSYCWTSEGLLPDGDGGKVDEAGEKEDEFLIGIDSPKAPQGLIAKKKQRYAQAKLNAAQSAASLARFLKLVAKAQKDVAEPRPFSVVIHSLGCQFLKEAVQGHGAANSLNAAVNIVLASACTPASEHVAWINTLHPNGRVYMTYTQADTVLAASFVADHHLKLGTNPGATYLTDPEKYRYIVFDNAKNMATFAHRYYLANPGKHLSKHAKLLFQRVLNSRADCEAGKERDVYPVRSSHGGTFNYMGVAQIQQS